MRLVVDIPIRLVGTNSSLVGIGRLTNLSLSGALIATRFNFRLLSRIELFLELPLRPPAITAYIVRKSAHGMGLEWCEFAPRSVLELVRAAPSHCRILAELPSGPIARQA